MRCTGLAISRTLGPGIEGTSTGAWLRDFFRKLKTAVIVVPWSSKEIVEMQCKYAPGARLIPILPNMTKYRKKAEAYRERAVELCEAAQDMHAIHDLDDWTKSAVMIADIFFNVHPGYELDTKLVVDGEIVDVSLEEMKKRSGYK